MPAIADLLDRLQALPSGDGLFNPYDPADPGGPIRTANLARYLEDMARRRPQVALIFEAPGYRGCRLSGIPVTSERIMLRGIARWGLFGEGYRATSGVPGGVAEMTATILWSALQEHAPQPPLIWNTVPLHPHRPGEPQSNRPPTPAEQRLGAALIEPLLAIFEGVQLLAVGRVAQRMLAGQGRPFIPLRHPSQGGKPAFVRGLREAMGG